MSGKFAWDLEDLPLAVVRYVGSVSDAEFQLYLREYAQLLDRGIPYAVILDASLASAPTAAQRGAQAKFLIEQGARCRALCRGGAFVISSPLIRGALTAILWVSDLPFEHTVEGDIYAAAQWTCARLGIPVPARFQRPRVAI